MDDKLSTQGVIMPTISISFPTTGLPDDITGNNNTIQITDASADDTVYRNNIFTVGGSGITEYSVTLNTPSGKTGELVGREHPYATIGKVAAKTSSSNFEENTWGYAISAINNINISSSEMVYNPVPSGMDGSNNNVELASRYGVPKNEQLADSYKIAFAARLGNDLPADHYEADIYISVVASAGVTISNIATMQEMTDDICFASYIGESKQLLDNRIDAFGSTKKYWVTKLADNNCWMTQNLDYDIPASELPGVKKIASAETWVSNSSVVTVTVPDGTAAYYDPGSYYYADGKTITPIDESTTDEDLHYHIGNYYSWYAAAKGAGTSIKRGDAPDSICPNGWKLPAGGNSNDTVSGAFGPLINAYNDTSLASPVYLVSGGYVANQSLRYAGSEGYYWSSTAYTTYSSGEKIGAYHLYVRPATNAIVHGGSDERTSGMSVRCVAQ